MAQLTQLAAPTTDFRSEIKILGLIGTGHFISHSYYLTLPLLITFLAADYGFGPTQLGIFIAAFSIAAAAAEMPVGFLVDAIGARALLVGELLLEALAIGGTIFAFMSTGRLIGSSITPIVVGVLIANDMTDKVFIMLAALSVLGLATLYMPRTPSPRPGKAPD